MCLVKVRPVYDDDDVVFANRRASRREVVYTIPPPRRSGSRTRVSRVSETRVREHSEQRPAQYIQAPRSSGPIIREASPPIIIQAASTTMPTNRIEVVSVEESRRGSPRTSHVSVSEGKRHSRHGSRAGEEVYIERERERVRLTPDLGRAITAGGAAEYDTYRYIEAPKETRYLEDGNIERRRSRSITYETNPRHSGRVVERERVVVEDDGRRREYYRRG